MPPKQRRRRQRDDERSRLRRQLQTIKQELRDANTGRFSKRSSCIRLPPYEQYAKMYRTVLDWHQIHLLVMQTRMWCLVSSAPFPSKSLKTNRLLHDLAFMLGIWNCEFNLIEHYVIAHGL